MIKPIVEIHAAEAAELFPFAARKSISCERRVRGECDVKISVEELLAAVAANPPVASVHENSERGSTLWAFYVASGGGRPVCRYALMADMTVAEARALRDAKKA